MKTGRSSRRSMQTTTAIRRAKRQLTCSRRSLPLSQRRPRRFTSSYRRRLTLSELMQRPSLRSSLEALASFRLK
ncbi:hypothetical protein PMAYCL1PPCAC_16884 [Pristionchus mayeri]|uniref:Uncharacterized protein n=1 Tax=Pristionchus mayeri TaxID=1317129 RepID=A0AAN5CLS0_9BILA|nr:hypothetical protein PMAYCL1PPCAC_16884 [Pristionchus mayeri]